jgi:hypothetical protein
MNRTNAGAVLGVNIKYIFGIGHVNIFSIGFSPWIQDMLGHFSIVKCFAYAPGGADI